MFLSRSKALFAVGAVLMVGSLLLSGCIPASQVAQAASSAAAPDQAMPAQQAANGGLTQRTITVVGRGEVSVKPDVAHTNVGVEITSPTVAAAITEARSRMNAVLDALKKLGIADKDIQTSNFSISFERQQQPQPMMETAPGGTVTNTVAGVYHVSNMVSVTIRDLDKVGAVLDAAIEAGANNIWGVNFSLDNTNAPEAQAREQAITDAKARAEALAKLTGVTVGDVMAISEVVSGGPVPVFSAAKEGFGGGGGPVEAGEVTFSTQIQVIYAIK